MLSDKILRTIVPASNSFLANGGAKVDRVIRDDILRAMRVELDVTLIRGEGSSAKPKGLLNWADAANLVASAGLQTVASVTDELTEAKKRLADQDVPREGWGYLISPRTEKALRAARTTTGDKIWSEEMDRGMIEGVPFKVTSQIPDNLGGGSDESEVYLAKFDFLILAQNEEMRIETFRGGTWSDNGTLRSGIAEDQTVIAATSIVDFGPRQRGKEIAVITGVKWDTLTSP